MLPLTHTEFVEKVCSLFGNSTACFSQKVMLVINRCDFLFLINCRLIDQFTGDRKLSNLEKNAHHHVQVREAKFKQRIKMYTGIWCCVLDKTPGHIYYDIYWDLKTNWKPLPPATPEDDHKPQ